MKRLQLIARVRRSRFRVLNFVDSRPLDEIVELLAASSLILRPFHTEARRRPKDDFQRDLLRSMSEFQHENEDLQSEK